MMSASLRGMNLIAAVERRRGVELADDAGQREGAGGGRRAVDVGVAVDAQDAGSGGVGDGHGCPELLAAPEQAAGDA